jgi:DNA polymerase-3 subunit delta'
MDQSLILGHEQTMAFLDRVVDSGRPAHAYLFSGPDGVGKKSVAMRFAARLNCLDRDHDPDFQCDSCRKILTLNHPDLWIEKPIKSIIRIDSIRSLQSLFKYDPVEARYRTAIIDDAHCMNIQAQNALLKTLEEPPSTGMLILITSQLSWLLPTVRSRCRLVRFNPLPRETLAARLQEVNHMAPDEAATIAGLAQGSFSRARQLMDSPILEFRLRIIRAILGLSDSGVSDLIALCASISSDKTLPERATEMIISWLRDVLALRLTGDESLIIHRDLLDTTEFASENLDESKVLEVAALFSEARSRIRAPTNINRTLILEVALLKAARIMAGPAMGLKPH